MLDDHEFNPVLACMRVRLVAGVALIDTGNLNVVASQRAQQDAQARAGPSQGRPARDLDGGDARASAPGFDTFLAKYQAKCPDACECLKKDREGLLTFYDFPAEHWIRLRTTNPIESTFATIRLRHGRTKGNGTRKASLAMMFNLAQTDQKGWKCLHGSERLALVVEGRIFVDGVLQNAV
jgi:hypothetical protein